MCMSGGCGGGNKMGNAPKNNSYSPQKKSTMPNFGGNPSSGSKGKHFGQGSPGPFGQPSVKISFGRRGK